MKIINTTKQACLAENAVFARTVSSRLIGLLNRASIKPGEALVIIPSNSIHTFFMRFNIDVVFIDKDNAVLKTIPQMRPFRLSPVVFKASSVIELPAGTIQTTQTQAGDKIEFAI